MALLEIANLTVKFATATGSLRAVDGVNYLLMKVRLYPS